MTAQPKQRPIPAAPSPGSSAKRAKLSPEDRRRIDAQTRAKSKDLRPRPERVGIRHRFTRGDVDWAILEDGHLWVIRAGDLEPGVPVRVRGGYHSGRTGHVEQLLPTWGEAITVLVRWDRLPGDRRKAKTAFMSRERLVVQAKLTGSGGVTV